MPVLTIQPTGAAVEFAPGATILQTLLGAGAPIPHKCEGNAKCGSCHIFLLEGRKSVSRLSPAENERLDQMVGVGSKSRLACQVVLGEEDVAIELLTFASGG
jgi:2Fe-2S ferredoxin